MGLLGVAWLGCGCVDAWGLCDFPGVFLTPLACPSRIDSSDFEGVRAALQSAETFGEMQAVILGVLDDLTPVDDDKEGYMADARLVGSGKSSGQGKRSESKSKRVAKRVADRDIDRQQPKRKKAIVPAASTAPELPDMDAWALHKRAFSAGDSPQTVPRVSDNPVLDLLLRHHLNDALSTMECPDAFLLKFLSGSAGAMVDVSSPYSTGFAAEGIKAIFRQAGKTSGDLAPVFALAREAMPADYLPAPAPAPAMQEQAEARQEREAALAAAKKGQDNLAGLDRLSDDLNEEGFDELSDDDAPVPDSRHDKSFGL